MPTESTTRGDIILASLYLTMVMVLVFMLIAILYHYVVNGVLIIDAIQVAVIFFTGYGVIWLLRKFVIEPLEI